MFTELFWIPTTFAGRLAVASRPRGGDWLDDEIAGWKQAGVITLVSMLTPEEASELDLEGEATASAAHGIAFRSLPVPDRDVPASRPAFRELVEVSRENWKPAAGSQSIAGKASVGQDWWQRGY